jgi:hypothetical protein
MLSATSSVVAAGVAERSAMLVALANMGEGPSALRPPSAPTTTVTHPVGATRRTK